MEDIVPLVSELMNTRHHISPKRLGSPGPTEEQKKIILEAAGTAPDHGLVTPWHFYEISDAGRVLLGRVFSHNLKERDPGATPEQLDEAHGKALRGPYLLLAVTKYGTGDNKIPRNEKLISAGCAIQNIILTAHAMGFGAGLSSGHALYSPEMKKLFKLEADDEPLVFITIGTVIKHKDGRVRPAYTEYSSIF
ncbi:nitroreductase [Polynucleobacter sp.]|uniref:nitroreductase family protein n=1 Tax=Polynucleobacter sp. TaxID=2029855 RepID=UPI00333E87D4